MTDYSETVHATCVSLAGQGVLIIGPSGSGKSGLALQLIALGAILVADDRTILSVEEGRLIASPPAAIKGLIEARGVGILPVRHVAKVPLVLCVDMSRKEAERLPLRHSITMLDISLPSLHKVEAPYFPAAIHAYLTGQAQEA
ncbi:HPr kinase/phosphorylase [Sulfitobacter undariae]|uniref:HPr kinase/phosphorylase n=1 Tax=Sulfitobacter undariae TaxID=1563671 RepID=A0A7W6E3A4_9RHOB|nr:HPr kinase/phosphatase C-terminal domain-containing protein [Sulfitobacter undariae]MBB3992666.1 HPr kinase/phosphorylase [Sulfitobacter undariae]